MTTPSETPRANLPPRDHDECGFIGCKRSQSETPLTDAIPEVEIFDRNGQPYLANLIPLEHCRALELRLNECVEALEKCIRRMTFEDFADTRATCREAIANARNPII